MSMHFRYPGYKKYTGCVLLPATWHAHPKHQELIALARPDCSAKTKRNCPLSRPDIRLYTASKMDGWKPLIFVHEFGHGDIDAATAENAARFKH
jgi:hypothetical protein